MTDESPERVYARLAPYLAVHSGLEALDWYGRALLAETVETYDWEGKLGHATLRINDSEVMISDEFDVAVTGVSSPKTLGGTTCTVSLTVDDVDDWYARCIENGAEPVRVPTDEFYGRMGKIRDPFGHTWGFVGPKKG